MTKAFDWKSHTTPENGGALTPEGLAVMREVARVYGLEPNAAALLATLDARDAVISDGAKWIPLSERSPEPEVDVLLVDYRGNRCVGYKRKEGRGWSVPAGCLYVEPNHWMPLPEAPK